MLGLTSKPDSKAGLAGVGLSPLDINLPNIFRGQFPRRTFPPKYMPAQDIPPALSVSCWQHETKEPKPPSFMLTAVHTDKLRAGDCPMSAENGGGNIDGGNYPGVRCQEGIICLVPGLSHVINGTLPSYQSIKGQSGGHLRTPAAFRSFPAETPAAHNSLCWGRRRLLEIVTMLLGKVMRSGAMR